MGHRDRIKKYREHGGAADLVRVEVLVPRYCRDEVVAAAQRIRSEHRGRREKISPLLAMALSRYGARILDNVDLARLEDIRQRAREYQALYSRYADLYRPLAADAALRYGSRLDQPWIPNPVVRLIRSTLRSLR